MTGTLSLQDGRYVYRDPSRNLVVTGPYPEWVLLAASEMTAKLARAEAEMTLAQQTAGPGPDGPDPVAIQAAEAALLERFDLLPQCFVSLGPVDYKWTDPEARPLSPHDFMKQAMKRLMDVTLKRSRPTPGRITGSSLDA